ncbi:hypothetical protein L1987_06662 [Smallanthus sonchifolius]|uniref:Uncharacterized protein n=1 Tax=Smallanthus sonchifolius TaxID=185202 RepID=A0ACB9JYS5_9ASTR|nr:hypothetical protein L1987_06662 [Smallanthus sonchifolius]
MRSPMDDADQTEMKGSKNAFLKLWGVRSEREVYDHSQRGACEKDVASHVLKKEVPAIYISEQETVCEKRDCFRSDLPFRSVSLISNSP